MGLRAQHSQSIQPIQIQLNAQKQHSTPSGKSQPHSERKHQDHIAPRGTHTIDAYGLVHAPIPIPKAFKNPRAKAALDAEWSKLEAYPAWRYDLVRSRKTVEREAKKAGKTVHFGTLMELCHEKHAELNLPPERNIFKGRIVFRGDIVKDEQGYYAVFSEQGTSSSHIAATKFMDALARFPGNDGEDADARGAYCQIKMEDYMHMLGPIGEKVETWISLPKHKHPASWANIPDPVVPLERSLYGHPLAGLFRELHCESIILKLGFEKVKGWECMYFHRKNQVFLSVYVDDFKLAGKRENLAPTWAALRKHIDFDDPVKMTENTYLGCSQHDVEPIPAFIEHNQTLFRDLLAQPHVTPSDYPDEPSTPKKKNKKTKEPSTPPKTSETQQSKLTTNEDHPDSKATTYPLAKSQRKQIYGKATQLSAPTTSSNIRAWEYSMEGQAMQCIERYSEYTHVNQHDLPKVVTPCIDDHHLSPSDFAEPGELEDSAAKIVLKFLYLARKARPDILWTVNTLAREVTRWNRACDKRLHRLTCYVHHTQTDAQHCYVGDPINKCSLALFVDASFAADTTDSKSTSGAFICLIGPNTFVPMQWVCKKQGATSHSSAEAELIALEACLRTEGLPCLMLWELITDVFYPQQPQPKTPILHPIVKNRFKHITISDYLKEVDHIPTTEPQSLNNTQLIIFEDNDAVIKMCVKGRAPHMKHIPRTHKIDTDRVFERIREDPSINIKHVSSKSQIADIFTKGSFSADLWEHLRKLTGIQPPTFQKPPPPQSSQPQQAVQQNLNGSCTNTIDSYIQYTLPHLRLSQEDVSSISQMISYLSTANVVTSPSIPASKAYASIAIQISPSSLSATMGDTPMPEPTADAETSQAPEFVQPPSIPASTQPSQPQSSEPSTSGPSFPPWESPRTTQLPVTAIRQANLEARRIADLDYADQVLVPQTQEPQAPRANPSVLLPTVEEYTIAGAIHDRTVDYDVREVYKAPPRAPPPNIRQPIQPSPSHSTSGPPSTTQAASQPSLDPSEPEQMDFDPNIPSELAQMHHQQRQAWRTVLEAHWPEGEDLHVALPVALAAHVAAEIEQGCPPSQALSAAQSSNNAMQFHENANPNDSGSDATPLQQISVPASVTSTPEQSPRYHKGHVVRPDWVSHMPSTSSEPQQRNRWTRQPEQQPSQPSGQQAQTTQPSGPPSSTQTPLANPTAMLVTPSPQQIVDALRDDQAITSHTAATMQIDQTPDATQVTMKHYEEVQLTIPQTTLGTITTTQIAINHGLPAVVATAAINTQSQQAESSSGQQ